MLKNEMESYVRIGEMILKNLTYPYLGLGGKVKNCQNHPYVIMLARMQGSGSAFKILIGEPE